MSMPSNSRVVARLSYRRNVGATSDEPCPFCGRKSFPIKYWLDDGNSVGPMGYTCAECGDPLFNMQQLDSVVNG